MNIGEEPDMAECRYKGLAVVVGHKRVMKAENAYHLSISNPEAWTEAGIRRGADKKAYELSRLVSYQELWDKTPDDWKEKFPAPNDSPDFVSFAKLAGTLYRAGRLTF